MQIVLTSCGIVNENLKLDFLSLFNKNPNELKVLYVTTAIDGEISDDFSWVEREFNSLLNLGILKQNIIEYKIGNNLVVDDFDIIYMIGGNTFYLMHEINKFKFDKVIRYALERNIVYVGSSAGSIILGNSIDVALPFDENKVKLIDFSGLGIVDSVIIPHAQRKQEFIKHYINSTKNDLIILND